MIRKCFLVAALSLSLGVAAHDIHESNLPLRHWRIIGLTQPVDASFLLSRHDTVFLETADDRILSIALSRLGREDQAYVSTRIKEIERLNASVITRVITSTAQAHQHRPISTATWLVVLLIGTLVFTSLALWFSAPRRILVAGLAAAGFGLISAGPSRTHTAMTVTDPLWMDSAFAPFKPSINTFWDSTYFHVESSGIPTTHSMMTGITKWQQQVPIPQCYEGNNSWSIPLNPVLAATPVPVSPQHFLRGAVAMAVNGVPIFNPYTNTGVDAFLDGQLDNWGGHSGRADDYHYHTAPLHLYNHVAYNAPIAFGLDGFAVYGTFEPDGSPVLPLDTNHGHFGSNGVYHYHGTPAAPYMIGNMVGQVTEDTTLQIVPQARAYPVRPSLTPLNGAVITGFHPNGSNGYTLIYTLSGQTDSIYYHWTNTGQYTYEFYTQGTGVPTVQNYNGFVQCFVSTGIQASTRSEVLVYPNPVVDELRFRGVSGETGVMVFDAKGVLVKSFRTDGTPIGFEAPAGLYYYQMTTSAGITCGRFVKQ
jgi:hypothetical protein